MSAMRIGRPRRAVLPDYRKLYRPLRRHEGAGESTEAARADPSDAVPDVTVAAEPGETFAAGTDADAGRAGKRRWHGLAFGLLAVGILAALVGALQSLRDEEDLVVALRPGQSLSGFHEGMKVVVEHDGKFIPATVTSVRSDEAMVGLFSMPRVVAGEAGQTRQAATVEERAEALEAGGRASRNLAWEPARKGFMDVRSSKHLYSPTIGEKLGGAPGATTHASASA